MPRIFHAVSYYVLIINSIANRQFSALFHKSVYVLCHHMQALSIWWPSTVAMVIWWITCTGTNTPSCSTTPRRTSTTTASFLEEAPLSVREKGKGGRKTYEMFYKTDFFLGILSHSKKLLQMDLWSRQMEPVTDVQMFHMRRHYNAYLDIGQLRLFFLAFLSSSAMCPSAVRAMEATWTWAKMSRRSTCPCRSR